MEGNAINTMIFRGVEVDLSDLPSKGELLEYLSKNGPHDRSISHYREQFDEEYGNELMCRIPDCFDEGMGVVIVPVKEGFLLLPYSHTDNEVYEIYDLELARLLGPEEVARLETQFKEFTNIILGVLTDIGRLVKPREGARYKDNEGNLYFVRAGIGGDTFKAFKRPVNRKKGQHAESGVRSLQYVSSRDQAQFDLDAYARNRKLTLCP